MWGHEYVITSLLENAVSWSIIKERGRPQRANLQPTLIQGHAPCLSGRRPSSALHHFGLSLLSHPSLPFSVLFSSHSSLPFFPSYFSSILFPSLYLSFLSSLPILSSSSLLLFSLSSPVLSPPPERWRRRRRERDKREGGSERERERERE